MDVRLLVVSEYHLLTPLAQKHSEKECFTIFFQIKCMVLDSSLNVDQDEDTLPLGKQSNVVYRIPAAVARTTSGRRDED